MQPAHEAALATLHGSFKSALAQIGGKPGDLCRMMLARMVKPVDPVDLSVCTVIPQGPVCRVTFAAPVTDAASMSTWKYRNPNNVCVVDDSGNWLGVVAYFREGMIEEGRKHLHEQRVHAASL